MQKRPQKNKGALIDDLDFPEKSKRKKRKKWPYIVLAIAGIFLLFLGLIGILPGTNRPRDLNIRYSKDDYIKARSKIEPSFDNLGELIPNIKNDDLGNLNYNVTLSESEVSALINEADSSMPIKDIQVKINDDGSIESSGMMDIGSIFLPIYIKGRGEIISHKANFSIDDLRIGSFPVPTFIRDSGIATLNSSINDQLKNAAGIEPSEVTFSEGEIHFSISRN